MTASPYVREPWAGASADTWSEADKGYSCILLFDLYDHFGLDLQDIKSFDNIIYASSRFRAWYILQHLKIPKTGCKAFVDYAHHEGAMEVEIEGNE